MKKVLSIMAIIAAIVSMSIPFSSCKPKVPEPDPDTPGVDEAVLIEISNITDNSAHVKVTSEDSEMMYLYAYADESLYEQIGEDGLVDAYMQQIQQMCEYYQMTVADYVAEVAVTGSYEVDLGGLSPNKHYYFFTFGVDAEGNVVSDMYIKDFTTEDVIRQDITFNIEVTDITPVSATVNVTPSNNDGLYYFDLMTPADLQELGSVENFVNMLLAEYQQMGYSGEDLAQGLASQGPDSYDFANMQPGTEYVVVAIGVNSAFVPNSEEATKQFKTTEVPRSDMTFQLDTISVGVGTGKFKITPSKDEDYLWGVVTKKEAEQFNGDMNALANALINSMKEGEILEEYLLKGEQEVETKLIPGEAYYLLAFGYNYIAVTDIAKLEFTAKPITADPCQVEYTFDYSSEELSLTISPSDYTWFYPSIVDKATYEELKANESTMAETLFADFKGTCELYNMFMGIEMSEVAKMLASYESTKFSLSQIPTGEYYAFAIPVDVENVAPKCGNTVHFSEMLTINNPGAGTENQGLLNKNYCEKRINHFKNNVKEPIVLKSEIKEVESVKTFRKL